MQQVRLVDLDDVALSIARENTGLFDVVRADDAAVVLQSSR
jgi:hypothetical protein